MTPPAAESRSEGVALAQGNSGVRSRTHRAILDAAVTAWARDFTLPLSDIAERAQVSRSTLHRYFPDKEQLVEAAHAHAMQHIEAAAQEATADAVTAAEELEGLMRAGIATGDAIIFLFTDPSRFSSIEGWAQTYADGDPESIAIIERAQAEGSLASDLEPQWALGVFYSLVYVAAESVAAGASMKKATRQAVRTFFHGTSPAP